jgi:PKD repeat protein
MKKYLLLLFMASVFVSCSKSDGDDEIKPIATADFEYKSELFLNEDLAIDNKSVNGTSFAWDFGDGTTSTEKEPKHFYATSGEYNVKLTVNGDAVRSQKVKVNNGTHSVVVKNNTQNTFQITLFDRIDENTVGTERFEIATLAPGATSAPFYTSKTKIAFGGHVNGWSFVSITPRFYTMEGGKQNVININNDTALTLGLEVPK